MYGVILGILVVASVFLVIFILMQSDKGGGLAGSLGGMGGGGGMPFSGREAATILSKLTTGLAIGFMAICILLSIMSRNRAHSSSDSALQKRAQKMQKVSSQAASSVLDQRLPLQNNTPMLPEGQGEANVPGAAQEATVPLPVEPGKAAAPAPAKESAPEKETAKPLFGN